MRFGVLAVVGLALLAAAFAAGLGISGTFATHDDPNELHACVSKYTGQMRYVVDPAQCNVREDPVSWNGGNGLASVEFVSSSRAATANTNYELVVRCGVGNVLIDAGYTTNPSVGAEQGTFGPVSTSAWKGIVRPNNNTTLTANGICAYPSGGGGALTQGPEITIEEVEE